MDCTQKGTVTLSMGEGNQLTQRKTLDNMMLYIFLCHPLGSDLTEAQPCFIWFYIFMDQLSLINKFIFINNYNKIK